MKTLAIIMVLIFSPFSRALAQHDHHPVKRDSVPVTTNTKPPQKVQQADTVKKRPGKAQMTDHAAHTKASMPSHAYSRSLPMSRNASGTAWNPDASPMYMWLNQKINTDWMFHGSVVARYTHTDILKSGERGAGKLSFPNWFMAMMNRKAGKKGLFNATAMISLDALTETGNGYPLLFQSGETWKGRRLVDRQHPHDLFSSLSIGYTQLVSKDIDVSGYLGYPGEPALGAPAFMHRVSSMNNPDAPLSHHWQDATHITFGVATLGLRYKQWKAEGSVFTGREPGENRYNFDKPGFDSYAYRLSFNPTPSWAFQFSQGFIREPETLEPGINITRTTASVLFARQLKKPGHISAALIWGLNDKGDDHRENSLLLEGNYQFNKNALFSRYEFIQKSADELDLEDELGHGTFAIHSFSVGYNRSFLKSNTVDLVAGTKAVFNLPAAALKPLYGDIPIGLQVYLQVRPALHKH